MTKHSIHLGGKKRLTGGGTWHSGSDFGLDIKKELGEKSAHEIM